eukprot:7091832-Prymnesium_polylepis.1
MRGQLTDVRMLNLSDMANVGGWSPVTVEGKPPNAVAGYACAVWEGKQARVPISNRAAAPLVRPTWTLFSALG